MNKGHWIVSEAFVFQSKVIKYTFLWPENISIGQQAQLHQDQVTLAPRQGWMSTDKFFSSFGSP